MSSCDDVLDLLPEVMPHLPPLAVRARAFEVQEHLRLCPSCAESAEEMARVVTALTTEAAPAPELSADFADRVLRDIDALPKRPADHLREVSPTLVRIAAAVMIFAGGFGAAAWSQPAPAPTQIVYRDAPLTSVPAPSAPSFQPAQLPVVQRITAAPGPGSRAPSRQDGLERYVTEANLVLEAVTALDRPDPHWMQVISRHVDEAALLDQGEYLLVELSRSPDRAEARALRPLINATQVVLRKVRHAPEKDGAATLTALRREVHEAGLLDAYRALYAPSGREADPELAPPAPPGVSDPL